MSVYVLGDNKFGLSQVFEAIAQQKKVSNVFIVANRKFNLDDGLFNAGLLRWKLIFDDELDLKKGDQCYLTGMSPDSRTFLINLYKGKVNFEHLMPLVHPSANIAKTCTIGWGTRFCQGVIAGPLAKVGNCCLINRGAMLGQYSILEDYVSINAGVIINGESTIGRKTIIGAGTVINDGVSIGRNCIIGSGAVVTRNIPDNVIAYGIPAKVIKEII